MARGINKVILVGNLGNDPDVRFTPSGDPIANISVATSESWTDKQSGQRQEKTEWHRVVMFGKIAEIAQQYLRKGAKVYIEGKLQTRKWTDQGGTERYTTEVIVDGFTGQMQMIDSRRDEAAPPPHGSAQPPAAPAPTPAARQPTAVQPGMGFTAPRQPVPQQPTTRQPAPHSPVHSGGVSQPMTAAGPIDFDDDIPF